MPCSSAALIAAITAANTAGGGAINLAPRCHYALTAAVSGEDGLPPVTTRIAVNGNGATIDGTGAVRVFEVDGPGGNLSLTNVTITGGSADNGGGIENAGGTVTLNFSTVTRQHRHGRGRRHRQRHLRPPQRRQAHPELQPGD